MRRKTQNLICSLLLNCLVEVAAAESEGVAPVNVWIDTDLACGATVTTDVDDCLALAMMLSSSKYRVVGISTLFGNANLETVNLAVKKFRTRFAESYPLAGIPNVYVGSEKRIRIIGKPVTTAGSQAISLHFKHNRSILLALGPLSNIATAIMLNPWIVQNIEKLVIVGGTTSNSRRFFPGDNRLISFRDFNLIKDKYATAQVIESPVRVQLAGYELAAGGIMTREDVTRLNIAEPLGSYLSKSVEGWQAYWQTSFSIEGFYPFDLMAARSLIQDDTIRCECSTVLLKTSGLAGFGTMHSLRVGEGNREVLNCVSVKGLSASIEKGTGPI